MTDLAHALESVLAQIERGASVDEALAAQGEMRGELAPLVALALSASAQPGLAMPAKSAQSRLLVAEAARLYPVGGTPAGSSDGGGVPAGPGGGGVPASPSGLGTPPPPVWGPALLGLAAALLLSAVLSGVATLAPQYTAAPPTATPPPKATAALDVDVGAQRAPTSEPVATRAEPAFGTGTPVATTPSASPSASPSPTASGSPTPATTIGVPPVNAGGRDRGQPPGSASPSPTATQSGYPAPTTTQVFAPTPRPPYP